MDIDKLVMMSNQIGSFFTSQEGNAEADIAAHIKQFWDPRMRAAIIAHEASGGTGMDPMVRKAVQRL